MKHPFINKNNHQNGLTLIEFMIVIAGVSALIAIAFILVPQMFSGLGSQKLLNNFQTIRVGANKWRGDTPNYTGIAASSLDELVPKSMVNGANLISDYGNFTITAVTISNTDDAVQVVANNIPTTECETTVPALASTAVVLQVGATTLKDIGAGTVFDKVASKTACDATATASITYTFRR